jgi:fumarylacetoacetase
VVTLEALEPYRVPGPPRGDDDPPTLEYLQPTEGAAYDITVEAYVSSEQMRQRGMEPLRVSQTDFAGMYWTIAQMLVHHTSTGCNLQPGDLMGSGTISGPDEDARGCLLERTWRGQNPLKLPDGTERKFLQDGDAVVIKAFCEKPGTPRIGFGECRGVILPAD